MNRTQTENIADQMKQLLRSLDYFFVLRPIYFLPAWAVLLSGHYVQAQVAGVVSEPQPHGRMLWIVAGIALLVGATAILRQIRDRQSGLVHAHIPYIVSDGFLTPKAGFVEAMALSAAAVLIGITRPSRIKRVS